MSIIQLHTFAGKISQFTSTHLDGLAAVNGDAVEVVDGGLRGILVDHRDEGVTFSGVVDIGHLAAAPEFVLENLPRAVLIDAVDEKLRALRHGVSFEFLSLRNWPRKLPRVESRFSGEIARKKLPKGNGDGERRGYTEDRSITISGLNGKVRSLNINYTTKMGI